MYHSTLQFNLYLVEDALVTIKTTGSGMQQWICSELPFLFPLLLHCFLSMPSTLEGAHRGGREGLKEWRGGFCFQGDGNTRLYTAAAALCNRAVTMTVLKGLGWRKKGRSSLCLRATHTKRVQIWKSVQTLCRHDREDALWRIWRQLASRGQVFKQAAVQWGSAKHCFGRIKRSLHYAIYSTVLYIH